MPLNAVFLRPHDSERLWFGSVMVWGWNGSSGSGFRFRLFLRKKGFSVFQYSLFQFGLTGKDGFGSWNHGSGGSRSVFGFGKAGSDGSGFQFRFGSCQVEPPKHYRHEGTILTQTMADKSKFSGRKFRNTLQRQMQI